MWVIFTASSDSQSAQHSSRIVEPILRWLFPHLATPTVHEIAFLVRKCAHLTEFAALALLFWRALRQPLRHDPRPWLWSHARLALLGTMLYAASDEYHQVFVKSREGKVEDVVIDSAGAALGLLALWTLGKWRKHW